MSKVVHLSDDAHTNAKNFCKQHGLKMSDWVADLIAEAIREGRTDPKSKPRPAPAAPAPAPVHAVPVVAAAERPAAPSGPAKKKLATYDERPAAGDDGVPPWAAPPFWARAQSK